MLSLLNNIANNESLVSNSIGLSRLSQSLANDIYEAYIFFLIIDAAIEEDADITYVGTDGTSATELIFRNSPGVIYSTRYNYTHAVIDFGESIPLLEVHLGIKLVGGSTVLHEADVVVLNSDAAKLCRSKSYSPKSSHALLAVECKFYTSNLQLHLARSFLGLVQDLSVAHPFFISNTSSQSVEKLLSSKNKHWDRDISPSAVNGEVGRLMSSFRVVFKDYKARER